MRPTRLLVTAGALLLGMAPGAGAAEPLQVTSVSPPDGATLTATAQPTPITLVVSGVSLTEPFVEVSTSNSLGQDGTLADDYQVAVTSLFPSDANPAEYRGSFDGQGFDGYWTNRPGTYYWQVSGTSPSYSKYIGPVWQIVIAPNPAAVTPAEQQRRVAACGGWSGRVSYLSGRIRVVRSAIDLAPSARVARRLRKRNRRLVRERRRAEKRAARACKLAYPDRSAGIARR